MEHDNRSAALRRALVDQVSATGNLRPSFSPQIVAAAIAVFALAGAGTGGAVAAFATGGDDNASGALTDLAAYSVGSQFATTGSPLVATGDKAADFDLGTKPLGATGVAVAIACIDPGPVVVKVNGVTVLDFTCEVGASAAMGIRVEVPTGGPHALAVAADGRFAVNASWVKPEVQYSDAQLGELADGAVTAEEYKAAFDRYSACLLSYGHALFDVDTSTDSYYYNIPGAAIDDGTDAECYLAEFEGVQQAWLVLHPSDTATIVLP